MSPKEQHADWCNYRHGRCDCGATDQKQAALTSKQKLKRFTAMPFEDQKGDQFEVNMEESGDGEWIRYEDIKPLRAALLRLQKLMPVIYDEAVPETCEALGIIEYALKGDEWPSDESASVETQPVVSTEWGGVEKLAQQRNDALAEVERLRGAFKNFHRLLCERFGYCHDENDWQRDQLSLIEHIAKRITVETTEKSPDEQAAAWRAVFDELLRYNPDFAKGPYCGQESALREIRRLQALDRSAEEPAPSRSVQRRLAAQRGEPASDFGPAEKANQRWGTPEEEAEWAEFGDCPRCWRCSAPVITIPGSAPGCIRNCPPPPEKAEEPYGSNAICVLCDQPWSKHEPFIQSQRNEKFFFDPRSTTCCPPERKGSAQKASGRTILPTTPEHHVDVTSRKWPPESDYLKVTGEDGEHWVHKDDIAAQFEPVPLQPAAPPSDKCEHGIPRQFCTAMHPEKTSAAADASKIVEGFEQFHASKATAPDGWCEVCGGRDGEHKQGCVDGDAPL